MIRITGTQADCATWVHRTNRLGHIYLAATLPFHILIMRNTVGQVWRPDAKHQ